MLWERIRLATAVTAVLAHNYIWRQLTNSICIMESMRHLASTKYNVSVITIFFFFNKYTVYCMLHRNNIRTATAYFTHLHNTVFVCAVNIRLNRCVTVFDKIYQVSALSLSQDKGNVMPKWHPEKKGLGVIAISSQHCLREASAELVKHLSC